MPGPIIMRCCVRSLGTMKSLDFRKNAGTCTMPCESTRQPPQLATFELARSDAPALPDANARRLWIFCGGEGGVGFGSPNASYVEVSIVVCVGGHLVSKRRRPSPPSVPPPNIVLLLQETSLLRNSQQPVAADALHMTRLATPFLR